MSWLRVPKSLTYFKQLRGINTYSEFHLVGNSICECLQVDAAGLLIGKSLLDGEMLKVDVLGNLG